MVRKFSFSALGLLFLLFAYFQWNDPDSLKWILLYLLVAVMSFSSAFRKNKAIYLWIMIATVVVWMAILAPGFLNWLKDGMPSITSEMKASSPYIEIVREFLGLFLAFISLSILLIAEPRKSSKT